MLSSLVHFLQWEMCWEGGWKRHKSGDLPGFSNLCYDLGEKGSQVISKLLNLSFIIFSCYSFTLFLPKNQIND